MRYVIVDPEGSSRAYFGSLREVFGWATAVKAEDPDLFAELQLISHDRFGSVVANQWLSDYFPGSPAKVATSLSAVGAASVSPIQVSLVGLSAGWYGKATSTTRASRRPQRPAIDTPIPAEAEMAVAGTQ
jgi:hypothetical protein